MKNDFSVIIVNFNTYSDLKKCLSSLLNLNIKLKYEIIVIDNNSNERSIENIKTDFPRVNILFSKDNKGFGSACNKGAEVADSKYFVFVNPDTIFFEDPFSPIFEYMEMNKNTGVCSGILENEKKALVYTFNDFPGFLWEIMGALGIGEHRKILKLLKNPEILNRSRIPMNVGWLIGAFLFFRADLFKNINGFDEDYFLYYEDVDIQKRVKSLNLKIEVLPNIRICHNERSSVRSFEGENLYYFHMMRSKIIYYSKHVNIVNVFLVRIIYIIGILLRLIALPVRREFKGKKPQKYFQYKIMLKILFSSYKKIISFSNNTLDKIEYKYSKEFIKDKFW